MLFFLFPLHWSWTADGWVAFHKKNPLWSVVFTRGDEIKGRCQTINAILQILPKVHLAPMEVKRKRNLFAQTEKKLLRLQKRKSILKLLMIGAVFVRNCKRGVGLLVGLAPFLIYSRKHLSLGQQYSLPRKLKYRVSANLYANWEQKIRSWKKIISFLVRSPAIARLRELKG